VEETGKKTGKNVRNFTEIWFCTFDGAGFLEVVQKVTIFIAFLANWQKKKHF
jgi:hypothetical protein